MIFFTNLLIAHDLLVYYEAVIVEAEEVVVCVITVTELAHSVPECFIFLEAELTVEVRRKIEGDLLICLVYCILREVDMLSLVNVNANYEGSLVCVSNIVSAAESKNGITANCERLEELTVYAENRNGIELTCFHRNTRKEVYGGVIREMNGLEDRECGFTSLDISGGTSPNYETVAIVRMTGLTALALEAYDLAVLQIKAVLRKSVVCRGILLKLLDLGKNILDFTCKHNHFSFRSYYYNYILPY
jgi:hypothetical protein